MFKQQGGEWPFVIFSWSLIFFRSCWYTSFDCLLVTCMFFSCLLVTCMFFSCLHSLEVCNAPALLSYYIASFPMSSYRGFSLGGFYIFDEKCFVIWYIWCIIGVILVFWCSYLVDISYGFWSNILLSSLVNVASLFSWASAALM